MRSEPRSVLNSTGQPRLAADDEKGISRRLEPFAIALRPEELPFALNASRSFFTGSGSSAQTPSAPTVTTRASALRNKELTKRGRNTPLVKSAWDFLRRRNISSSLRPNAQANLPGPLQRLHAARNRKAAKRVMFSTSPAAPDPSRRRP